MVQMRFWPLSVERFHLDFGCVDDRYFDWNISCFPLFQPDDRFQNPNVFLKKHYELAITQGFRFAKQAFLAIYQRVRSVTSVVYSNWMKTSKLYDFLKFRVCLWSIIDCFFENKRYSSSWDQVPQKHSQPNTEINSFCFRVFCFFCKYFSSWIRIRFFIIFNRSVPSLEKSTTLDWEITSKF